MAKLNLFNTILSKLSTLTKNDGNLIACTDEKSLYFDFSGTRYRVTDCIECDTEDDRLAILSPIISKFYFVKDTNKVWKYTNSKWVCLNPNEVSTADKLANQRTISLTGAVVGSGKFDGSANLAINTTANHTHDVATTEKDGFMSSKTVTKLKNIFNQSGEIKSTSSNIQYLKLGKIKRITKTNGQCNRVSLTITGKQGWNWSNCGGTMIVNLSFNFPSDETSNFSFVGGICYDFGYMASSTDDATKSEFVKDSNFDVLLVRQQDYEQHEVDVYLKAKDASKYMSFLYDITYNESGIIWDDSNNGECTIDPTENALDIVACHKIIINDYDNYLPSTVITTSIDFNNVKTTGVYHIKVNGCEGLPMTNWGTVYVDFKVGSAYQIYIPDGAGLDIYKRKYDRVNEVWLEWNKLNAGNADTATALTSSAGSSTQPVYFENGKPVICDELGYLPLTGGTIDGVTRFINEEEGTSIEINGRSFVGSGDNTNIRNFGSINVIEEVDAGKDIIAGRDVIAHGSIQAGTDVSAIGNLYGQSNLSALLMASSSLSENTNISTDSRYVQGSSYISIDANGTILKIMYGVTPADYETIINIVFPTPFSSIPTVTFSLEGESYTSNYAGRWNDALFNSVSKTGFSLKSNEVDYDIGEDIKNIYWIAIGI